MEHGTEGQFSADGDVLWGTVPRVHESFRDQLRKRVAPLAFFAALALLANQTCQAEAARVTVRLELGDAATRIDRIRVDYFQDDEPIDVFIERDFRTAPVQSFEHELQVPEGLYEARIRLGIQGATKQLSRRFQAGSGAVVVLDLTADAAAGSR